MYDVEGITFSERMLNKMKIDNSSKFTKTLSYRIMTRQALQTQMHQIIVDSCWLLCNWFKRSECAARPAL